MQACAVEMCMDMSQEPPHTEISRGTQRRLCASLRSGNALAHFTGAFGHGNLEEKCQGQGGDADFMQACAVTWTCHKNIQEPLDISLRGNLWEKCRRPEGAPWSSTGFYLYSQNIAVGRHCLEKNTVLLAETPLMAKSRPSTRTSTRTIMLLSIVI